MHFSLQNSANVALWTRKGRREMTGDVLFSKIKKAKSQKLILNDKYYSHCRIIHAENMLESDPRCQQCHEQIGRRREPASHC